MRWSRSLRLAHLQALDRSATTVRAYSTSLKLLSQFLDRLGVAADEVTVTMTGSPSPVSMSITVITYGLAGRRPPWPPAGSAAQTARPHPPVGQARQGVGWLASAWMRPRYPGQRKHTHGAPATRRRALCTQVASLWIGHTDGRGGRGDHESATAGEGPHAGCGPRGHCRPARSGGDRSGRLQGHQPGQRLPHEHEDVLQPRGLRPAGAAVRGVQRVEIDRGRHVRIRR